MNQNRKSAAAQNNPRQYAPVRRTAAAAAGYTTYEGGNFRNERVAHRAYGARPEQSDHPSAQAAKGSAFRIPRGEKADPASSANPAAADHASQECRAEHDRRPGDGGRRRPEHAARNGGGGGKGKKRAVLILLLVVALVLAGVGFWKWSQPSTIEEVTGGWFYDQTSTEIQEAIDHEVEDGYFNMSINTSVPVSEGIALANIKNIEENKYDCIVTITLDDGTQVYRSGGLAPGSELKYIELTQIPPAGDYQATALFEIYEQDEAHTKAGQTASKITLHVQ